MSGFLGESDIDAMLADLAEADSTVEVTLGATTVTGLFDRAAVQFFDGDMPTVISESEAVHVRAGSLPGLEPGASITITIGTTSTTYSVLRVLKYGDGAMERIALTTP